MVDEKEDRAKENDHSEEDDDPRYSTSMQDLAVQGYASKPPKPQEESGKGIPHIDLGDGPQLPEQKKAGSDVRPADGPQPGAAELRDKPAQTEFDTIGTQVEAGPAVPDNHPEAKPDEKPEAKPDAKPDTTVDSPIPADDLAGTSGSKGDSNLQFCSADSPLSGPNQASDVAGAVNVATGGRHANNPFFSPSSGALGLVTGFDVSPLTIAGYVEAAWSRLGSLNDALSGRRPADFHPINGPDGKPAVINMPQHFWQSNPSISLGLNGRNESITMSLPGFNGNAVTLVTDGTRVLAIDPKNNDTWQLQQDTLFGYRNGYSWTKLPKR